MVFGSNNRCEEAPTPWKHKGRVSALSGGQRFPGIGHLPTSLKETKPRRDAHDLLPCITTHLSSRLDNPGTRTETGQGDQV